MARSVKRILLVVAIGVVDEKLISVIAKLVDPCMANPLVLLVNFGVVASPQFLGIQCYADADAESGAGVGMSGAVVA